MNQTSDKELFSLPKSFPFTIYHAAIPSQGVRTMQWHDCLELNYVVNGQGHYMISDVRYEVEPGQILRDQQIMNCIVRTQLLSWN